MWREQSKLETERQVFLEQKRIFEKEKQKYMEAVCKLDREVNNVPIVNILRSPPPKKKHECSVLVIVHLHLL